MMPGSEWEGEPHTLIVRSVTPPAGQFDDGEIEYDIEHPASCKQEERGDGDCSYLEWTCEVAEMAGDCGLPFCLKYSGTPVTEPGTYRIQSWGRKYYVPDYGAYEYDAGIVVMPEAELDDQPCCARCGTRWSELPDPDAVITHAESGTCEPQKARAAA